MNLKIKSRDLETIAILYNTIPEDKRNNIKIKANGRLYQHESWQQVKDLHNEYG